MGDKKWMIWTLTIGFALLLGFIIYTANSPGKNWFGPLVAAVPYGDKVAHFFLIGTMTLLLNIALKARSIKFGSVKLLLGSVIMFFIVTVEEFTQLWNDNRTFDWIDMSFNYLGILVLGSLVLLFPSKWRSKF